MIKRTLDRRTGRHRARPGRTRVLIRFATGGVAAVAAAVLAISLSVSPGWVAAKQSARNSVRVVHLTAHQIRSLQHMTPAQDVGDHVIPQAGP